MRLAVVARTADVARLAVVALGALALGCASAGDPPGGPPDTTPPHVLRFEPDSGAVLAAVPGRVSIVFDEVISEQVAAQQRDIGGAVIFSPARGKVSVDWHRERLSIEPKDGFRPGLVYRVELLPVVTDLRLNKMKRGRLAVFTTGPEIPEATLRGTVVDWVGGKAAPQALVEAVLMPDSLPYRTLADSSGDFTMAMMPPGDYLVYGVLDLNGNRRREPREAYDTLRVTLRDSAVAQLYAFTHDTIGPRPRSVELLDSVTVKLTFDRPLDPTQVLDTSNVRVAPQSDTTRSYAVERVLTPAGYDSLKAAAAAADSARRAAEADSAARARRAAGDTSRPAAAPPPSRRAVAPAAGPVRPAAGGPPVGTANRPARHDTTAATRMLIARAAPTDNRVIRLVSPVVPDSHYYFYGVRVRGLTRVVGVGGHATLVAPKPPPPPRRARTDSLRATPDTTRRDTTGAPARVDTTRAPARPDTLHTAPPPTTRPDSSRPASSSPPP